MRRIILFLLIIPVLFSFEFGAFDPPYWNGVVIYESGKIYGFRFAFNKNGKIADGYDTFFLVHDVGPFAPDGSYAEVSFDTSLPFGLGGKTPILKKEIKPGILTLRYGKFGNGIVGELDIPENISAELIFYFPWGMGEKFILEGNKVFSEDGKFVFIPLDSSLKMKKEAGKIRMHINKRRFYFYAGFENFSRDSRWIVNYLNENKKKYENKRPKAKGEWEGLISSITNNLFWMKLLQPDKGRIYIPAGRRWIFPGPDGKPDLWTMFEWDSFFNALEASVEDCRLAENEIEAVLDTQYPWGNIPNWRSARSGSPDRGQPPVGAFAVLKTYLKCGNLSLIKNSYERLKKFHFYWSRNVGKHLKRDGNNNGLYEWGSDTELIPSGIPQWEKDAPGRLRAAWESGQDDLPNFDNVKFNEKTNTLEMDCIDLSSLYALDSWSLWKMAELLGNDKDRAFFEREFVEVSDKINSFMWDDKRHFYFDRYWNGKLSNSKASSNFYPLLAGVADEERVKYLISHLLNPSEFWGDFVIPTISRDNPSFNDQQYWRGTIWPPTNYLVYQGLKRYGIDLIAAEFARKSARLFLNSWKNYRLCRENYDSRTGEGGGQRYQSWGPLFALVLLEDFIDVSPFFGLSVGNLAAQGETVFENLVLAGNKYNLKVSAESLVLYKNGSKLLEFKGRGVLKNIVEKNGKVKLDVNVYSNKMFIRKREGEWVKLGKGIHRDIIL